MNEPTFKFFYSNYNGGPEIIISNQDDIYSNLFSISEKEYFLYSTLKETDNEILEDESNSNISELNNTDLSSKSQKGTRQKFSEKIKNYSNMNLGKRKEDKEDLNKNEKNQRNFKEKENNFIYKKEESNELSQINEGEFSKEYDQSNLYDSDLLRKSSKNSDNLENSISENASFTGRVNHPILNKAINENKNMKNPFTSNISIPSNADSNSTKNVIKSAYSISNTNSKNQSDELNKYTKGQSSNNVNYNPISLTTTNINNKSIENRNIYINTNQNIYNKDNLKEMNFNDFNNNNNSNSTRNKILISSSKQTNEKQIGRSNTGFRDNQHK